MDSDVEEEQLLRHFNTLKTMIKDNDQEQIVEYMTRNRLTADRFQRDATRGGRYLPCPVCVAAKLGRLDVMNNLISMGFTYEHGSPDDLGLDMSPLHLACYGGHLEIVRSLIDTHGVDIMSRDCYDNTPLYWAINKCRINIDLVRYLIENGAAVNERNRIDNSSLLHVSVRRFGNPNVCECLISHGADVTARDHQGNTPLHDAALWGHEVSARALLDAGADVNARSRSDDTPFLAAAKYSNIAMMKLLYSYGADPALQNKEKNTALHFAAMKSSQNIARYLTVDLNVDPSVRNKDGVTPFWQSICEGDLDVAKLLFNTGCHPYPSLLRQTTASDFRITFHAEVPQNVRERIMSFVKEVRSRTKSLQDLCIFKIRRELGRRLYAVVDALPLPQLVKDLIKLCHLSLEVHAES